MNTYTVTDGNADVEIEADSSGLACAEYLEPFDREDATYWVVLHWRRHSNGLDGERKHPVHPIEPPCDKHADGHNYETPHQLVGGSSENPGVWGHGGGCHGIEVCRCGVVRRWDSWATDPQDGEQGLDSHSYDTVDCLFEGAPDSPEVAAFLAVRLR